MTRMFFTLLVAFIPFRSGFSQDLLETYQLAKNNDPDLKSADYNMQATNEIKSQSIAQMLPNVSLSGGSSFNRLSTSSGISQSLNSFGASTGLQSMVGTVPTLQHFWNNSLNVNLKQPVFHWDHWIQLNQADNKIAQTEAQFQAKQQALIRRTAEAYFNVLAALDNLKFSTAEKLAIGKQLEQAKQRFDVGVIPITDVYEAQAGYDRSVANEIEAQNQVDNTKEALREIIGQSDMPLNGLQAQLPLSPPSPADIAAWSNSAESNNFSLVAQLNQTEYVRKSVEIQEAKHLPTLDLIAQYSQTETRNFYAQSGDAESVGLQLNVPIFEGGATASHVRQAEHEYEAAKEDLIKVKRNVSRNVKDAYRGVVSNISRIQALEANCKSAEMAVQAAEAGFDVGTRTMVDVVTEQRNLYKAKSDYSRSRYDYLILGIKLKEAAGSLSEEDLQQVNRYLSNL